MTFQIKLVFPKIGYGWFMMVPNPIKIDDLGGFPLFSGQVKKNTSQNIQVAWKLKIKLEKEDTLEI